MTTWPDDRNGRPAPVVGEIAKSKRVSVTERKMLRESITEHFRVLELQIDVAQQEMQAKVAEDLLGYYRQRDQDVRDSEKEVEDRNEQFLKDFQTLRDKYREDIRRIADDLKTKHGAMDVVLEGDDQGNMKIKTTDARRAEAERALKAKIPAAVASARLKLAEQRSVVLMKVTTATMDTELAQTFTAALPSVADLVPTSTLREITAGVLEETDEIEKEEK